MEGCAVGPCTGFLCPRIVQMLDCWGERWYKIGLVNHFSAAKTVVTDDTATIGGRIKSATLAITATNDGDLLADTSLPSTFLLPALLSFLFA